MLQNIGDLLKGQRWLAFLVLGLLILVFALWGTYGIVDLTFGAPKYGLKVNGEENSDHDAAAGLAEAPVAVPAADQDRDSACLVRSQLQNQLLDQYTRETLMHQRATERGFRVSDESLIKAYESEQAFQVDGKFSDVAAKGMLAQIGMSPAAYERELRNSLQISQLEHSLELGDFLTDSEIKRAFALENEQREVRYALLPLAPFSAAVKVDEARAKAWYDAHPDDYLSKESVRLQYAELRLDTIAAAISVNPDDLEAWYKQNQSRYVEPEKRHAQHILIPIGGNSDAAADAAAAGAGAGGALRKLVPVVISRPWPRSTSQDPGSAPQGGDLGWALRGAYVPAFADKLFSMKPGRDQRPSQDPVRLSHHSACGDPGRSCAHACR